VHPSLLPHTHHTTRMYLLLLCSNVYTTATCFNPTKRPSSGWYSNVIVHNQLT
jgi:hypothetical protein